MTAKTVYSKLFSHWLSDEHYFKVTATVYDEKFNNSVQKLDIPLIIHILEFIHPYLYCIISKKLISYCGYPLEMLPVSILISLNSIDTLESFKKVLLGYKFNYASFTAFVASWGDFETIKWFYSHGSCTMFHDDVLRNIAKRGDKKTLMKYFKLYKDHNFYDYEEAARRSLEVAAEFGHVKILQAAKSLDFDWVDEFEELMEAAAVGGQVEVLQWIWNELSTEFKEEYIVDVDPGFFYHLIEKAVKANHIDVLEWISFSFQWSGETEELHETIGIMIEAALNGNINIVRWLSSKNIKECGLSCIEAAVRGGNLEVLKYVRELGCPWSNKVGILAALKGNLEILKWSVLNDCPMDVSKIFPSAANSKQPNLEVYQWLFNQGCPFNEEKSFRNACKLGNFEFIVFAQSKGSPEYGRFYNKLMIQGAISTGNLEALRWAIDQVDDLGLALDNNWKRSDEQLIDPSLMHLWIKLAARNRHLHILEYFRIKFGNEVWLPSNKVNDLVEEIAELGKVDVLDWIIKYKPDDWNKSTVFHAAIKYQKLKILIWLKSQAINTSENWYGNICDIVPHPSDLAFEVGNLEIYKWIHQNGCPWNEHTNWLKLLTSDQDKSAFVDFAFQSGGVLNSKMVWKEIQEMVWRSERCVRPRHRNPMDDSTSESDG